MSGYLIYPRKSTEAEDRQVLSIESQTNELRQLASKLSLPVDDVMSEAKSAKEPGRPVFNAMMQRLYRGEAEGIICWKLDRLARNPVDGGAIIWAIKQHGIKVITPTQTFCQSDDNVILMYIEFGMAQKYIDDLSRNVKRGLKTKVEKGWYPGVAPLGYLNNKFKDSGERDLRKDPERFPLIRRMWDLMLTGQHTPSQILRTANDKWGFRTRQTKKQGGKPLSRAGIYRIFVDPFYSGWFEYPRGSSQHYQGKHEAMVTREEFDRVQLLLGRTNGPRPSKHRSFAFTGLVRCGNCAATITAEEKQQLICANCRFKFASRNKTECPHCHSVISEMRNPRTLLYTYYHCSRSMHPDCPEPCVTAKSLEEQIDAFLARVHISERFKAWAMQYLDELHKEEFAAEKAATESAQRSYTDCLKRLAHLVKLKTSPENSDGKLLSDEEYGKERLALLTDKDRLESFLRDTGQIAEKRLERAKEVFEFTCLIRKRFAKGDSEVKRQILSTIGSNLTLKAKTLFIEARKPFVLLEEFLPGRDSPQEPIEPENTGHTQRQKEHFASSCLTHRSGRDSNQGSEHAPESVNPCALALHKALEPQKPTAQNCDDGFHRRTIEVCHLTSAEELRWWLIFTLPASSSLYGNLLNGRSLDDMPLTQEEIREFAALWHQEYGEKLTDDEALREGKKLLELYAVLCGFEPPKVREQ